MNNLRRFIVPLLVIVLMMVAFEALFSHGTSSTPKAIFQGPAPSFTSDLAAGTVQSVVINTSNQSLQVKTTKNTSYSVNYPDTSTVTNLLAQYPAVKVTSTSPGSPWWVSALSLLLPIVLIIGFFYFMMRRSQGGGSKVMNFGKSRAKQVSVDSPKVTFKDVAGVEEAVEELHEIKEFLENPKKFQQLGAR
ncbi:MAG: cell division protein FtsH, partial [Thermoleophilia bacterium]